MSPCEAARRPAGRSATSRRTGSSRSRARPFARGPGGRRGPSRARAHLPAGGRERLAKSAPRATAGAPQRYASASGRPANSSNAKAEIGSVARPYGSRSRKRGHTRPTNAASGRARSAAHAGARWGGRRRAQPARGAPQPRRRRGRSRSARGRHLAERLCVGVVVVERVEAEDERPGLGARRALDQGASHGTLAGVLRAREVGQELRLVEVHGEELDLVAALDLADKEIEAAPRRLERLERGIAQDLAHRRRDDGIDGGDEGRGVGAGPGTMCGATKLLIISDVALIGEGSIDGDAEPARPRRRSSIPSLSSPDARDGGAGLAGGSAHPLHARTSAAADANVDGSRRRLRTREARQRRRAVRRADPGWRSSSSLGATRSAAAPPARTSTPAFWRATNASKLSMSTRAGRRSESGARRPPRPEKSPSTRTRKGVSGSGGVACRP